MKNFKKLLSIFPVFVLILICIFYFYRNSFIKSIVNNIAENLQVPLYVSSVESSFFNGNIRINKIELSNPEGWGKGKALQLNNFFVDIKPFSIFSDTIHLEKVEVDGLLVNYQFDLKKFKSNLGVIVDNIKKLEQKKSRQGNPLKKDKKSNNKYVFVDKINILNCVVSASINGIKKEKKIKDIYLENLGSEKKLLVTGLLKIVLNKIIKNSKKLNKKEEKLEKVIDSLKNIFK